MTESQQVLEWIAEGQLQEARTLLRDLLEERFGPLPAALAQRVEAVADLTRLRAAVRQVMRLRQIDDLRL